jgi:heme/copper-type cytochrome/quinol oxidase subunit 2
MTVRHWPSYAQVTLLVALFGLAFVLPWPTPVMAASERIFRVKARDFAFTPATIEVNPGDRVTIELESGDYVHGLYIEGYEVNLTADPGQPARVTFIADRPGTFRIWCSVPCGSLHPFMGGRLRVGPPVAFWRALLLSALAVIVGGLALRQSPRSKIANPASP